eukprot:scaffold107084_cov19-Tisochrysis_lutea.AAC.1
MGMPPQVPANPAQGKQRYLLKYWPTCTGGVLFFDIDVKISGMPWINKKYHDHDNDGGYVCDTEGAFLRTISGDMRSKRRRISKIVWLKGHMNTRRTRAR